MKKKKFNRDVYELKEKINDLLIEYNAKIEYNKELERVIIVDKDTTEFASVDYLVGW